MFEATGNYLILKRMQDETTESGFVLASNDSTILAYEVIDTPEGADRFKDRVIMAHKGMVSDLGQGYFSVLEEEVRAVKSK